MQILQRLLAYFRRQPETMPWSLWQGLILQKAEHSLLAGHTHSPVTTAHDSEFTCSSAQLQHSSNTSQLQSSGIGFVHSPFSCPKVDELILFVAQMNCTRGGDNVFRINYLEDSLKPQKSILFLDMCNTFKKLK